MAAEPLVITDSNQDIGAEVREAVEILRELRALLVRFGPLLDQFAVAPVATSRAMRKAARRV